MNTPLDPVKAFSFLALNIAFGLIPGPDFLCIVGNALQRGRSAALTAAAGMATGGLVHMLLAVLGLSTIIAASPDLFGTIRIAGAGYLGYLGAALVVRPAAGLTGGGLLGAPYIQGFLSNALNPKVALCFVTVIPQFVDDSKGMLSVQLLLLGLISIVSGWGTNAVVAFASANLAHVLRTNPALIMKFQRFVGLLLLAMAAVLVLHP